MWDPKHNILSTKKENWMERTCIENGRRSTSKKKYMTESLKERETEVDRWKDGETHWNKQAIGLHEEKKRRRRVVGRQPNAPAAFTPGEIPGTHFQRLSPPQGTWFCRKEPRKISHVTRSGIDPGTVRLVAQRLNHYATPGPTVAYLWTSILIPFSFHIYMQY